jgi:hypothetical protein
MLSAGQVGNEKTNVCEPRVGDGGLKLSAGQARRLTIARAIYHRPAAVLPDEAVLIVVPRRGRMAEIGTGEQLLEHGGLCRYLYAQPAGRAVADHFPPAPVTSQTTLAPPSDLRHGRRSDGKSAAPAPSEPPSSLLSLVSASRWAASSVAGRNLAGPGPVGGRVTVRGPPSVWCAIVQR